MPIILYKPKGLTPLQAIEKLRADKTEFADKKLGVAGRLDPMACGVMLILVDSENKEKDKYLRLEKEYTFEILFGISTDSYDILGLTREKRPETYVLTEEKLNEVLPQFRGRIAQQYPPYSTKTVLGKSLHQWAREKRLNEVKLPKQKINIYKLQLLNFYKLDSASLWYYIESNIAKVSGDFRQNKILKNWHKILKTNHIFPVAKLVTTCSSGTYVRALAHEIGIKIGIPTLALTIKRTRVGNYKLE